MPYSLTQAAAATGKNKSTILRAIKAGKISGARDDATGGWFIQPAELHRVYPVAAAADDASLRNGDATQELRIRLEAAAVRIADKDEVIADLRQRLDRESEERRRLTAMLMDDRARDEKRGPIEHTRRSWWPWRRRAPSGRRHEGGNFIGP
jgi:hypothetical protein